MNSSRQVRCKSRRADSGPAPLLDNAWMLLLRDTATR